jgi:hypothetical protein
MMAMRLATVMARTGSPAETGSTTARMSAASDGGPERERDRATIDFFFIVSSSGALGLAGLLRALDDRLE